MVAKIEMLKPDPVNSSSYVFIIGSPRSGTTVLGELLDKHPYVSQWYEPYFVWDYFFRTAPHDERTAADATLEVQKQIFKNFSSYKKRRKSLILVDKSPRNSLKIPFILNIFPQAKFIHILRDGRDVTLSIHKEWMRRRNIVQNPLKENHFNYGEAFRVIGNFLKRQPLVIDKLRALWFETHGHFFNKKKHLNQLRWKGEIGWGPRFKDWESVYLQSSLLQFNAYQWVQCTKSIKKNWELIPKKNKLSIRYEDLITNPQKIIGEILSFLKVAEMKEFFDSLPPLKANNYNKWKVEFTGEELKEIHPILTPQLIEFGYAESKEWIDGN